MLAMRVEEVLCIGEPSEFKVTRHQHPECDVIVCLNTEQFFVMGDRLFIATKLTQRPSQLRSRSHVRARVHKSVKVPRILGDSFAATQFADTRRPAQEN